MFSQTRRSRHSSSECDMDRFIPQGRKALTSGRLQAGDFFPESQRKRVEETSAIPEETPAIPELFDDLHSSDPMLSSSPGPSNPMPPTPESFQSQDKIISQNEFARRGSLLSPKRPSSSKQPQGASIAPSIPRPKQKFTCSGTCPELLCSHRPELAIPKPSNNKQNIARFTNLTGFLPKIKRQSQYEVPRLSAQSIIHPHHHGALPSLLSTGSKIDTRLAKIKSDIEVFKSPVGRNLGTVKVESPLPHKLPAGSSDEASRFSSASTFTHSEDVAVMQHKQSAIKARDEGSTDHYRKKFRAPDLCSDEGNDIEKSSSAFYPSRAPSRAGSRLAKHEDSDVSPLYPGTPVSLK